MKKGTFLFMMLVSAWTFQSCGDSGNSTSGTSNSTDPTEQAKDQNDANKTVAEDDSKFVVTAASGGMMEVEAGQMAQQKGVSERVKNFGAMMVRDHTQANNELKAMAATKNIAVPTGLSEEHQKHINDLREKTGKDFDHDYMSMMVDDHKEDIDLFEKASNKGTDADVKAFAAKTLPVLRTHLDSAQAVNDAVKK